MKFDDLLHIVEDEPVFESGLLLSGAVDAPDVHKQLSRWVASGKLYQLRRGLYSLAPPHRRVVPHPFLVANSLMTGSYVSLQSALAYYGIIPEFVPLTTSVTTGRTTTCINPLGQFDFRHVRLNWFHGYRRVDVGSGQQSFIAAPEKALLDLVYLQPQGDDYDYLQSLRLQALHQLDVDVLERLALAAHRPKLKRALENILRLVEEEKLGFEIL